MDATEMKKNAWWRLKRTDAAWCQQLRRDHPEECASWDDERIRDYYADGREWSDTWDHLGDAREAAVEMMVYIERLEAELEAPDGR